MKTAIPPSCVEMVILADPCHTRLPLAMDDELDFFGQSCGDLRDNVAF
jgi:hypothetical protein